MNSNVERPVFQTLTVAFGSKAASGGPAILGGAFGILVTGGVCSSAPLDHPGIAGHAGRPNVWALQCDPGTLRGDLCESSIGYRDRGDRDA